ncbi:MAG: hypothetical protein ACRDP6_41375 [Actinoallomurus sp.]
MESHAAYCSRSIRSRGLADGWTERQIVLAIHRHCTVSLLRAHRLARDWTLEKAVTELRAIYLDIWHEDRRLSHQRLSQWEKEAAVPTSRYLDALCRVYSSRPDRLGVGHDYGEDQKKQINTDIIKTTARGVGDDDTLYPAVGNPCIPIESQLNEPTQIGDQEERERSSSDSIGGNLSPQLLVALRSARKRANSLFEMQSVSVATVDYWESVACDYGYRQLTAPHAIFLEEALSDIFEVQAILDQRQPLEFQVRLYRVIAQLAGLVGFNIMGAGALKESRAWFHTAQLAAEEINDRSLRAWISAWKGLSYYWDSSLLDQTIQLCNVAHALAGSTPTAAGAFAISLQARACARLGRHREAYEAIKQAEFMFSRLNGAQTSGTRLGFYERRLRYDQENVLTRLGDTRSAMDIQDQALALPCVDCVESAMLQLDRATCLIKINELEEGCRVATQTLLEAPDGFRRGVVLVRADEIYKTVRVTGKRLSEVRNFRSLIQLNQNSLESRR